MSASVRSLFASALMCLGCLVLLSAPPAAQAERIKDLASVAGVRSNQLIGYGLVVGLLGAGDQTTQTQFTVQSLKNMLAQLGVVIPPGVDPKLKNVAAVVATAELPAFAKPGQTIDVTVSSIGNAKGLRGGTLLMSPLKGLDGKVYAVAQGNVVSSGFGAEGQDGSRIVVNVPTTGRIPNGATVERAVPSPFDQNDHLVFNLHTPDFTTASRIAQTINKTLGSGVARPVDATSIRVAAPKQRGQRVEFLAVLENLTLEPGEAPARVIVNSRTGTVVIGSQVRVSPAAVSHGNLVVTITENQNVSQPGPFARRGNTEVTQQSDVNVDQQGSHMFVFDPGVTLDELVRAVNEVGAAPGDLVAILEALKQAGALHAQLIVI